MELARTLDDAEALAVTVAARRNYDLASDDPKVRTIFGQLGSSSRLISTPGLLHAW